MRVQKSISTNPSHSTNKLSSKWTDNQNRYQANKTVQTKAIKKRKNNTFPADPKAEHSSQSRFCQFLINKFCTDNACFYCLEQSSKFDIECFIVGSYFLILHSILCDYRSSSDSSTSCACDCDFIQYLYLHHLYNILLHLYFYQTFLYFFNHTVYLSCCSLILIISISIKNNNIPT